MAEGISYNSRRVAKNTLLLYLRMLLMMVIGLFTSRVVLQNLGVDDFGTYTVVYEMVMLFTIISNSVSNAISRFMAYEIGREDVQRGQKVFTSAIVIQSVMSVIMLVIAATAGLWYMRTHMDIPQGRMDAAYAVLACTSFMMVVQLFSIPFNATIIAHEQMKAFAYISILEAILKLAVAFMLMASGSDKLVLYAIMMLCVAVIIRSTYAWYCRRHFQQTRLTGVDRKLTREMMSFSMWSILGNGMMVMNTRGVSLLANKFFGVGVNAARGIALQVENIVKQFVSNFLTALNPQITKSWASGNTQYCHEVVGKGCKFSYLLMLVFALPFAFESETILQLWLGNIPQYAASFTSLTLVCLLVDMMVNPLAQLVLSTGKIARYYLVTSVISLMVFVLSYFAFRSGSSPEASYWIFIGIYLVIAVLRLFYAHKEADLPIWKFIRENVLGNIAVTVGAGAACYAICALMQAGWPRTLVTLAASTSIIAVGAYFISFTSGERTFVKENISRIWKLKSL